LASDDRARGCAEAEDFVMMMSLTPVLKAADLTAAQLRERLSYDPDTGIFKWIRPSANNVKIGDVAGSIVKPGYIVIKLFHQRHFAHRLAWLYSYGCWPSMIDHIDRQKSNNSLSNLREATPSQNGLNRISKGYCYDRREKRFRVSLEFEKKVIWIGYFDTTEAAEAAYWEAHAKYAKEFSPAFQEIRGRESSSSVGAQ
jgi:hypothetical protein